jgi:hypothetical protein
MEKSFTRADGLHFELKKSGQKTMIWEVTENGKFKRFETWRLQQVNGNPYEYDPNEVSLHFSWVSAFIEFEKNEKNNDN